MILSTYLGWWRALRPGVQRGAVIVLGLLVIGWHLVALRGDLRSAKSDAASLYPRAVVRGGR